MSITGIIRPIMVRRALGALRASERPEQTQRAVLARLLSMARGTEVIAESGLGTGAGYEEFREAMEPGEYEKIRGKVMRMIGGEK
ncbi:MAG: GH3 auxin-responsive promoter family protein, partial [Paramuribaculum sp.]|nr:GH3 auxin-responsive promoter family protein [Paramuribaculum sp.]